MNAQQLVDAISRVFPTAPLPSRDDIWPEVRGYHLEADQIADFFFGKTWPEITCASLRDEYVGDGSACLCFMNPQGFRYYYPAYMVIAIREYDDADVMADSALNALDPSPDLQDRHQERMSGFNSEQTSVITAFVEFMNREHAEDVD